MREATVKTVNLDRAMIRPYFDWGQPILTAEGLMSSLPERLVVTIAVDVTHCNTVTDSNMVTHCHSLR